jgi:hypothetical protein
MWFNSQSFRLAIKNWGINYSKRKGYGRRDRLLGLKYFLMADQRGAVAFEMLIVYAFLMMSVLLPLADVAIFGFRFLSARQALRAFGQLIQYDPPPDVTAWNATGGWKAALPTSVAGYSISDLQVLCGDTNLVCSAVNTASPKYYAYTTTVTVSPMVLGSVLCTSGNANPCSFTLPYSERFQ